MGVGQTNIKEVMRGFTLKLRTLSTSKRVGRVLGGHHPLSLGRGGKDSEREVTFLGRHSKLTKSGFESLFLVSWGLPISNCLEFQNRGLFLISSAGLQAHIRELKICSWTPPRPLLASAWQGLLKLLVTDYLPCLGPRLD